MTMTTYSRADGHSAGGAAAYRARASFYDQRRGRRFAAVVKEVLQDR
ncbi:hypothetical protein [Sulfitobacter sp.]